jgi:hypothetical protein
MKKPRKGNTAMVDGAESWRLAVPGVEAFVTRKGGHLAPVAFRTASGWVRPFSIAPWSRDEVPRGTPAVLDSLRGDFFCAPFGGNAAPWRGERHPLHGESASGTWTLRSCRSSAGGAVLVAEMAAKIRPGRLVKRVGLRAGETNVYIQHELVGMRGPMCLGHHATLRFSSPGRISFSPWRYGQVSPLPFENPAQGGYSALKVGAVFEDLRRVPLAGGGTTDLTRYPAREGYEDLAMVCSEEGPGLAWSAVAFPEERYAWFAVKDPRTLASTVMWHSNGGRHYPPWNGRHRNVLGLEDVTAYFAFGLAESAAPNPVSRRGIPTVLRLDPRRPLRVPYVMGVVAIPRGFDAVRRITFHRDHIRLHPSSGAPVRHPLDLSFLRSPGPFSLDSRGLPEEDRARPSRRTKGDRRGPSGIKGK